ncbi:MAG: hypothetical protein LBE72_05310 [Rickettsia sp.]|nr:hypothetical protein [Rickettsia sp.]
MAFFTMLAAIFTLAVAIIALNLSKKAYESSENTYKLNKQVLQITNDLKKLYKENLGIINESKDINEKSMQITKDNLTLTKNNLIQQEKLNKEETISRIKIAISFSNVLSKEIISKWESIKEKDKFYQISTETFESIDQLIIIPPLSEMYDEFISIKDNIKKLNNKTISHNAFQGNFMISFDERASKIDILEHYIDLTEMTKNFKAKMVNMSNDY